MNMPGFNAEAALHDSRSAYRHDRFFVSQADTVIPSLPPCKNCDWILDNCSKNGWRPRAVCNACYYGMCYSGPD
jgi:hypothetical protein